MVNRIRLFALIVVVLVAVTQAPEVSGCGEEACDFLNKVANYGCCDGLRCTPVKDSYIDGICKPVEGEAEGEEDGDK